MMTIGILGAGKMGAALAQKLITAGYNVQISHGDNPKRLELLVTSLGPGVKGVTNREVAGNQIIILAVRWESLEEVLSPLRHLLKGKILVDATNPCINNDILIDFGHGISSSHMVSSLVPEAYLVKAFNTVFAKWLKTAPKAGNAKQVIFISGDHEESKWIITTIINGIGYVPVDLGNIIIGGYLQRGGGPLAGRNFFIKP